MKKYLIDVNLPYLFSLWKDVKFIHQRDIDDTWTELKELVNTAFGMCGLN